MSNNTPLHFKFPHWAALAGCLLTVLLATLVCDLHYLYSGFWADDYMFQARMGAHGMGIGGATLADWPRFFDPARGFLYRPVFLILLSMEQNLFGSNPVPFHAVGLLLNLACVLALTTLVWRLSNSLLTATFSGVIFVCMCQHDQAVWWISSQSTLLAALFSLLALHCWISFRETSNQAFYWGFHVALVVGLLSKNEAVIAPVLAFLHDRFTRRQFRATEYLPALLLVLAFVYLERTSASYFAIYVPVVRFENASLAARIRSTLDFTQWATSVTWMSLNPFNVAVTVALVLAMWEAGKTKFRIALAFSLAWLAVSLVPVPFTTLSYALCSRFLYFPDAPRAIVMGIMLSLLALDVRRYLLLVGTCTMGLSSDLLSVNLSDVGLWSRLPGGAAATLLWVVAAVALMAARGPNRLLTAVAAVIGVRLFLGLTWSHQMALALASAAIWWWCLRDQDAPHAIQAKS